MISVRGTKVRIAAAALAGLAAIASAPVAVTLLGQQGITVPGAAPVQHLLSMLDARSPGEREKGELTQSKVAKTAVDNLRPRALGKTFPPKPTPTEQLAKVIVPATPTAPVEVVPPIAPPTLAEVVTPSPAFAAPSLASFGPPIIGGGGGGGGGTPPGDTGTVPPVQVPPVTAAVPEPGTWLMMLFGFGVVGSALRPRRRRSLRTQAA